MISLPANFDMTTFVANLCTLGATIVGIGLIFLTARLVFKVIKMAGSIG